MASRLLQGVLAALVVGGVGVVVVTEAGGGVQAEVTDKATDERGSYVVATTDVGGLEFQRYIPADSWGAVQEGDDVVYHLHTGETEIRTWERGFLIWRG
jgi:hypothetical protein